MDEKGSEDKEEAVLKFICNTLLELDGYPFMKRICMKSDSKTGMSNSGTWKDSDYKDPRYFGPFIDFLLHIMERQLRIGAGYNVYRVLLCFDTILHAYTSAEDSPESNNPVSIYLLQARDFSETLEKIESNTSRSDSAKHCRKVAQDILDIHFHRNNY